MLPLEELGAEPQQYTFAEVSGSTPVGSSEHGETSRRATSVVADPRQHSKPCGAQLRQVQEDASPWSTTSLAKLRLKAPDADFRASLTARYASAVTAESARVDDAIGVLQTERAAIDVQNASETLPQAKSRQVRYVTSCADRGSMQFQSYRSTLFSTRLPVARRQDPRAHQAGFRRSRCVWQQHQDSAVACPSLAGRTRCAREQGAGRAAGCWCHEGNCWISNVVLRTHLRGASA
jgi:hypothetical protein